MTWLWILLGAAAFLILLSLAPISIEKSFSPENGVQTRYSVMGLCLYHSQEKKKEKKSTTGSVLKANSELFERLDEMDFRRLLHFLRYELGLLKALRLHHLILELEGNIRYGATEPSDTAIHIAILRGLMIAILKVLEHFGEFQVRRVCIEPSWEESVLHVDGRFQIGIRLGNLVLAIFRVLVYTVKNREELNYILRIKEGR